MNLKGWIERNANRPLAYAIGAALCLQFGYLAYLARAEYSAELRRVDRVVETASLGIQQENRALIESALIASLRGSDAAAVALCRDAGKAILYPPSTDDPCRKNSNSLFDWTIRRKVVGMPEYVILFVINRLRTFASLAILAAISAVLWLAIAAIFVRARRRFQAEVLEPLYHGLNQERPLAIAELDELRQRNQDYHALSRRQAVSEALVELSAQVAHDIRSPLAALEVASSATAQLPEDKRVLLREATGRIRDIANSLLDRRRSALAGAIDGRVGRASPHLISSLIDPVVTEKHLQLRSSPDIRIELQADASSYGLFAQVQPVEFKRALSNLINNGVEALEGGGGQIRVILGQEKGWVSIQVQDNGKGFPPQLMANLGRRGATYGKAKGSGLGLSHARNSIESWGGRLDLASEPGQGATVTMILPRTPAPEWFLSTISLDAGQSVVVLDDDPSVHEVWKERMKAAGKVELSLFSTAGQLRRWIRGNPAQVKQALYLLDYELKDKATGLSLAEEFGLENRAVLVTGRFEDQGILNRCQRLKVRVLPKGLAARVPIRVRQAAVASGAPES